jgi:hypothetical protein
VICLVTLVESPTTFPRTAQNTQTTEKKAKTVNVVTASNTDGYGNLFTILSVFQSPCWWLDTGANVHVCADISMFTSYQVARDSSVLMGNGSHASVRGVGTVDLKFTSGRSCS